MALIAEDLAAVMGGASFARWYGYLPWEDWRNGKPGILSDEIEPRLKRWAAQPCQDDARVPALSRPERLRICFAMQGADWDEEKVLERYELLYEAGLAAEAQRDGHEAVKFWGGGLPQLGRPMQFDHRRVLATAMSRLRGKLKYRPVIFELMPDAFTLFELQKIVDAISGHHLH